ncbi:MAG: hypothetical protein VX951_08065 [Planctomycetota bacterium]|nr:hypothetical protein [Planctomycetota bacterium]
MGSSNNNDSSNSQRSGLSSAEYRAKLLTKLNCLIAVLQVAIAKISRSMDRPGANEERLMKIRGNLENTMSICNRAKGTLEKGLCESTRTKASAEHAKASDAAERMSYRDYIELSSIDEYKKFKTLPPISANELHSLDIDDLMRKFGDP